MGIAVSCTHAHTQKIYRDRRHSEVPWWVSSKNAEMDHRSKSIGPSQGASQREALACGGQDDQLLHSFNWGFAGSTEAGEWGHPRHPTGKPPDSDAASAHLQTWSCQKSMVAMICSDC